MPDSEMRHDDTHGSGTGGNAKDGLAELSSTLWRERELLELLLFKLEEEQILLATGRGRWLARATREVEVVLEEIRRAELLRSVQVNEAARDMGLGSAPSLRQLADASPEPWHTVLMEHRSAFMEATIEIQAMAEANRDLLTAGHRDVRQALMNLTDSADTYDQRGVTAPTGTSARLIDEAM